MSKEKAALVPLPINRDSGAHDDIRNMIHVIRGQQVMIDSDGQSPFRHPAS